MKAGRGKGRALGAFLLCAWLFFPPSPALGEGGAGSAPLHLRNGFPLFLGFVPPVMSGVGTEDALSLHVTYSSTHLVARSADWSAGLDLEAAVVDLVVRKRLGTRFEAGLRLSGISVNSGLLDGPLAAYHDLFGFPDYGRHLRPENAFLFELERGGEPVLRVPAGTTGLGDTTLSLKFRPGAPLPGLALLGFLDLPTGDASRGLGNGRPDGGAALLVETAPGRRLRLFADAGVYLPGDLAAGRRIGTEPFGYGGIDVEWTATARWVLGAQLRIQGSPLPRTGIPAVDDLSVILGLGGRWRPSERISLEFSFSEDPNTAGAPDFMLSAGLRFGLRCGAPLKAESALSTIPQGMRDR